MPANGYQDDYEHDPVEAVDDSKWEDKTKVEWIACRTTTKGIQSKL